MLTPSTATPSSSRSAPCGPYGVTSVPLARKPIGVGSEGMSLCLTKGMLRCLVNWFARIGDHYT